MYLSPRIVCFVSRLLKGRNYHPLAKTFSDRGIIFSSVSRRLITTFDLMLLTA